MGYSKRQFIAAALEEIGIGTQFDIQPEQEESALRQLDSMMAFWNARGVRLGYPLPGSPESSDVTAESQVPDSANLAIITNLAIRIAPSYGKTVAADTKATAKLTLDTLMARAAFPRERQYPSSLPRGAGQKPWGTDRPFINPPEDSVDAGPDGSIDFY